MVCVCNPILGGGRWRQQDTWSLLVSHKENCELHNQREILFQNRRWKAMKENMEHRCVHLTAQIGAHIHSWDVMINVELVLNGELYGGWAQKYSVSGENVFVLDVSRG